MPWMPPNGDAVFFTLFGAPWTSPDGDDVYFDAANPPPDGSGQALCSGFDASLFGAARVRNQHEYLFPTGFDATAFGKAWGIAYDLRPSGRGNIIGFELIGGYAPPDGDSVAFMIGGEAGTLLLVI